MEYVLSGVFAPVLGFSSFLIPFFQRKESNAVFVQDLDFNYRIVRFMRVDPENFLEVQYFPQAIVKTIGDKGILALRVGGDKVKIGDSDEIRDSIDANEIENDKFNFFKIDIYYFIGDKSKAINAIENAGRLFGNESIYKQWTKSEKDFANKVGDVKDLEMRNEKSIDEKIPDDVDKIIKILIENPKDKNWYGIWRDALRRYDYDHRLVDVAVWWLKRGDWGNATSGKLISHIFRAKMATRDLYEMTMDWLRMLMGHVYWPDVWIALFKKEIKEGKMNFEVIEIGFDYLNYRDKSTKRVGSNKWVRVWSSMFQKLPDNMELVKFAENAFSEYKDNDFFMRKVVLQIVRFSDMIYSESTGHLVNETREWLFNSEANNNVWCDLYCIFAKNWADAAIIDLGVEWLRSGEPNLKSWWKVWSVVTIVGHDYPSMWEIASEWLKRSDYTINTWPEIFIRVYDAVGIDDYTYSLAKEWVRAIGFEHHLRGEVIIRLNSRGKNI
ncbi:hypothetical protein ACW7BC_18165 [Azospirillum argentinense]